MRYIGIDVGKEKHAIAVIGQDGQLELKPKTFSEDAEGYGDCESGSVSPKAPWSASRLPGTTGRTWRSL